MQMGRLKVRGDIMNTHTSGTGHSRRVVVGLLVLMLGTGGLAGCNEGTPLGSVLGDIRSEINGVLDHATASGNALLITAGGQASLAVDNAISAFGDELNTGINRVDDTIVSTVAQLNAVVDQLQDGALVAIDSAIAGSQQIVNTLPFTNKNPQVRTFAPGFVAARSSRPVHLNVDGNFWWASNKDLPVSLSYNGTSYTADLVTTSEVGFTLPSGTFDSVAADTRVPLLLTAPYEKGSVFKSVEPGVFTLGVTVLPQYPTTDVQVTNTTSVTGTTRETRTVPPGGSMGGGWDLNSWDDCNDHEDSHTYSATPDGYRIDPASVTVHYTKGGSSSAGKASVTAASITGFTVVGKTVEHCDVTGTFSYGSGHITYYVTYDELKDYTSPATTAVPIDHPLGWGESWSAPVSRHGWQVNAKLWDGSVVSTTTTDTRNPYLSVYDQGDAVQIVIANPTDLLH